MNDQPLETLQGSSDISAPAGAIGVQMADEGSMPAIPSTLPILPVRSFVVFPRTVTPITIGRAASIKLLNENLPTSKIIGLITQRDEKTDEPQAQDLYHVGTAAIV